MRASMGQVVRLWALTAALAQAGSFAVEGDASAYFLTGYSLAFRKSFDNGFEMALGTGAFRFPEFLVESQQDNFAALKWEATCTSIQALRLGYRWSPAPADGLSTHLIAMNQQWKIRSQSLDRSTSFQVLALGVSAGYTYHIGSAFYLYPIASYTLNWTYAGSPTLLGNNYSVPGSGLTGSLHVGYEF